MNDYKGYSLFNEDDNDLRKAWNRTETIANINQTLGKDEAQKYFDHFSEEEKMKIKILLMAGSTHGRDAVLKKVNATLAGEE